MSPAVAPDRPWSSRMTGISGPSVDWNRPSRANSAAQRTTSNRPTRTAHLLDRRYSSTARAPARLSPRGTSSTMDAGVDIGTDIGTDIGGRSVRLTIPHAGQEQSGGQAG